LSNTTVTLKYSKMTH